MEIEVKINGQLCKASVSADMRLLEFLREQGYASVKCGCDTSNCGLCTVWLDEKPVLSCSVLAVRTHKREITTLEGLKEQVLAFGTILADQGAEQCGFCNPGFIMNVLALEKEFPNPTLEQIQTYLAGNLCRCSGYQGQLRAMQQYFQKKQEVTHG